MKFRKIRSSGLEFDTVWDIYISSFIEDERRKIDSQKNLFSEKRYNLYAIYENEKVIGMLAEWRLSDFIFIEHFALDEKTRGKGIGTDIIKKYIKDKKIIIEVEMPETEDAKRRIVFWQRLGFNLNKHDYVQPPYDKGKKPVHMFLMSFPEKLSKDEFDNYVDILYSSVYGID